MFFVFRRLLRQDAVCSYKYTGVKTEGTSSIPWRAPRRREGKKIKNKEVAAGTETPRRPPLIGIRSDFIKYRHPAEARVRGHYTRKWRKRSSD